MPLMTYNDYVKQRHSVPYTFILESKGNFIYYFGEAHSFDPEHPQWVGQKDFWNDFVKNTEGKKRIAFIEGGERPVSKDEKEAILNHGGMGLVTWLAHEAGIERFSPEPDEKYERDELEKNFTKEEIQYYYFARVVHQWHRKNPQPNFEEYINRYLEDDKKQSGWTDFDFSIDAMKKIHTDIFHTEFDIHDTDFFYNAGNPTKGLSVVNAVSRASSAIRDEYIVEQICKYVKDGYSIYLQFGCTHAVMQEPLLRELL